MLSQQSLGLTSMIGSMPHKNAQHALEALNRFPLGIPVWPQLPKRSFKEGMMPQYSEGFPGITVDEASRRLWLARTDALLNDMATFYEHIMAEDIDALALSPESAAGFFAFIKSLEKQGGKLPVVKAQVTGPFTFGLSINDDTGKAIWFDEQYRDIIVKGLAGKALWQAAQLKKYADTVIIFFDEPIFSALGTPAYMGIEDKTVIDVLNELSDTLHAKQIAVGVHCCGNMDWPLLTHSHIDIINFDAYGYGDKLALYPDAVNEFLHRGGTLAWGIVPTGNTEEIRKATPKNLENKINELMSLFVKKGVSQELVRRQILFTPSCGMGNLTDQEAEIVLKLLHAIGNSSVQ